MPSNALIADLSISGYLPSLDIPESPNTIPETGDRPSISPGIASRPSTGFLADSSESGVMLVLSRKLNESILIGDLIRVTVVEIRGDKIRLGIEAPRNVTVHRHEIYEAIRRQLIEEDEEQPNA